MVNIARCNEFQGHCEICYGCAEQKKRLEKQKNKKDERGLCTRTIEDMMNMSLKEYCGIEACPFPLSSFDLRGW